MVAHYTDTEILELKILMINEVYM